MADRTKQQIPVAKIRIQIVRDGTAWTLLSRKRAEGRRAHGLLEMFGGHLEAEEAPRDALLRELREEETTGTLARVVEQAQPPFVSREVDHAIHHLFELALPDLDPAQLVADPEESLGLELVRTCELNAGEHWDRLTFRTRKIFAAFGPPPAVNASE